MTDNPEAMLPVTQEDRFLEEWDDCGNLGWCRLEGRCTRHNPEEHRAALAALTRSTTDKDARIAELEAALEPFARDTGFAEHNGDETVNYRFKVAYIRRARQALKGQSK